MYTSYIVDNDLFKLTILYDGIVHSVTRSIWFTTKKARAAGTSFRFV